MVSKNKSKPSPDPIPDDFGTWEAAADFWDTHDLTDYEDSEKSVPNVQINFARYHFRVDAGLAQRLHEKSVNVESRQRHW